MGSSQREIPPWVAVPRAARGLRALRGGGRAGPYHREPYLLPRCRPTRGVLAGPPHVRDRSEDRPSLVGSTVSGLRRCPSRRPPDTVFHESVDRRARSRQKGGDLSRGADQRDGGADEDLPRSGLRRGPGEGDAPPAPDRGDRVHALFPTPRPCPSPLVPADHPDHVPAATAGAGGTTAGGGPAPGSRPASERPH